MTLPKVQESFTHLDGSCGNLVHHTVIHYSICILFKINSLAPPKFFVNLVLFVWTEIIVNVESLANVYPGHSLDHLGHGLAGDIQEAFDVQVVSRLRERYNL